MASELEELAEWFGDQPQEYRVHGLPVHKAAVALRRAATDIARLTREKETAEAALTHIKAWAEAYPVKVFTPLSDAEEVACAEALAAAVPSGCDRMHASWARHLLTGIGEVAAAALRQSESGDRT